MNNTNMKRARQLAQHQGKQALARAITKRARWHVVVEDRYNDPVTEELRKSGYGLYNMRTILVTQDFEELKRKMSKEGNDQMLASSKNEMQSKRMKKKNNACGTPTS
ncbi:MAG: hypothetical protein LBI48_09525 [Burkholderiaceae bacterium]|jgi:hypothetical protein|nr:hypothetical protein [Burkholderiaceae bacterium]